jgi:hypothetical protein
MLTHLSQWQNWRVCWRRIVDCNKNRFALSGQNIEHTLNSAQGFYGRAIVILQLCDCGILPEAYTVICSITCGTCAVVKSIKIDD